MYYYRYAPLLEVGLDMKNSQSPLLSKLRNDFWQSISHMYKDLKHWFGNSVKHEIKQLIKIAKIGYFFRNYIQKQNF